jgi:hypothetical protein
MCFLSPVPQLWSSTSVDGLNYFHYVHITQYNIMFYSCERIHFTFSPLNYSFIYYYHRHYYYHPNYKYNLCYYNFIIIIITQMI